MFAVETDAELAFAAAGKPADTAASETKNMPLHKTTLKVPTVPSASHLLTMFFPVHTSNKIKNLKNNLYLKEQLATGKQQQDELNLFKKLFNWTYCGDHFAKYTNIEPLHCIP